MPEPAKHPLKLFYCYAHEDKTLRDTLDRHLSILIWQGLIEIWYDGQISVGTEREHEIDKYLSTADIVLLLVSADFLASKYCYSKEMERALQRHEEGTARVIPIILRPVYWKNAPFSKLQVLPTGAKPVTSWGNRDKAYEDITRKIAEVVKELQASPKTAEEWFQKAEALSNSKRYSDAIPVYNQAIRLNPNNAEAYCNKGVALCELKQYEEAILAYNKAILLNPNDTDAYYNKGFALSELERYEEAISAYDQALQLNPNSANVYTNKGTALYGLKRHEEATVAFDHAIQLDPNYANAYRGKGFALNNLKRYDEASIAFEKAKQLGWR